MEKKIILIAKLEEARIDNWLFYHLSLGVDAIELIGNIKAHPSSKLIRKMQHNKILTIKESIDSSLADKTKEQILCLIDTKHFLLVQKNLSSIRVLVNEYFYEDYISLWENTNFPEAALFRGTCFSSYSEYTKRQTRFGYIIQDASIELVENGHQILDLFHKQIKLKEKNLSFLKTKNALACLTKKVLTQWKKRKFLLKRFS